MTSGFQIAPDALDLITNSDGPAETAERVLRAITGHSTGVVISRSVVERILSGTWGEEEKEESQAENTGRVTVAMMDNTETCTEKSGTACVDGAIVASEETENEAHEQDKEEPQQTDRTPIRKIKNPTLDSLTAEGTIEDFHALFLDRFERIKSLYSRRVDTQGALSLSAAKSLRYEAYRRKALRKGGGPPERSLSIKVIGMVRNKRVSRSRNTIIELEDLEDTLTCIIPNNRPGKEGQMLAESGNLLLLDEVICISGTIDQDGRLIADGVIFPDIPVSRLGGRAQRDTYAAFISDIHYGSKEFLEDEFDRFIDWLRGVDVDTQDRSMVSRVEYLFIAGDLCDGVGVYPTQQEDLLITSVREQYEELARKLRRLPERIKIICIPGNHDASRQALPRPPIPEEFAEGLYRLGDRVVMLGDPSQIVVEGVNVLLVHGDSLDDLVTQIPGASYRRPALAMKELLRKRHLAPLYGGKTELAPGHRDWLVIEDVPDIVHFGHAHHNAVDNYRGVQIINSGTFQSQTDFMRKQGIEPTPGIVTLVNLHTGAPTVRVFYDFATSGDVAVRASGRTVSSS